MAGVGAVWHLRYRAASASAYKWEFVGGATTANKVVAAVTATSPSNAGKPGGPVITIPLAGEYLIEYGATVQGSGSGYAAITPFYNSLTLSLGADNEAVQYPATYASVSEKTYEALTPAGNVLEVVYRTDAGTATFIRRYLTATPIRVG